ncbi:hypothetical protein [Actinoplanes sp. CA-252034]|uniref:hypothetical protein n=1 Tax=Actinoplanes sp. CA-252034 TaxID=3239906 RepID=UPI003D98669F
MAWIVEAPRLAAAFDVLSFLSIIVYIIGFLVWRNRTQALVRPYGIDPKSMVKHPGVRLWSAALILAYCTGRMARVDEQSTIDDFAEVFNAGVVAALLRLIGLACLAVAVWRIRQRVHASLAAYHPVFTPPPSYPEAAPLPAAPPAPARDVPGIDGLTVADDDFWHRVRQAGADGDLALLETSGPGLHRWVLIPADQDPAAVRAGLSPGAAITVFTEPLVRRETNGYRPPAADEYHGLLESSVTGALWYQSVTPRRLTSFLDRAETGGRWALHPSATRTC